MHIDILIGENNYGTTIHFSKALAEALERHGVKTRLYWIGEGHFFHAFYEIMADPPDFTCSFSDISLEKRPLADLWQIPHLFLMVDPPIYFLHSFVSKYSWVSCVDEGDCAFVHALNFPRVFFLPHAADINLKTPIEKEREFDAVFFGTCIDYEAAKQSWSGREKDLLSAASEKVLSCEGVSIMQALLQLGIQETELPRYHDQVDSYTRGKDRVELIRSLKDKKVHIWGDGPWKKYCPNLDVHPPLPFDKILDIMKTSKVVLNSSPRFKLGAHERVFYALVCGASVYTGENAYLKIHLPEIATYRYGEWETPNFTDWQKSAEAGQCRVVSAHTWDVRVSTLLARIST